MIKIDIPDNYPTSSSDVEIKTVVKKCQDEIAAIGKAPNVTVGSTYYSQLAEQGNSELMKRLNTELISNLEISSKRQRELTWAIVIIGGANLVLAILKLSNIIKV